MNNITLRFLYNSQAKRNNVSDLIAYKSVEIEIKADEVVLNARRFTF